MNSHKKIKNKDLTKKKILSAISSFIQKKGHRDLGVNKIAREAKVDKRLIYRYFKSFDRLIEEYTVQHDYWSKISSSTTEIRSQDDIPETFVETIEGLLDHYNSSQDAKVLLHWQMNDNIYQLNSINRTRERFATKLLQKLDFDDHEKRQHQILASLLLCGINYLVLQSEVSDIAAFGLDINNKSDRADIKKTVKELLDRK